MDDISGIVYARLQRAPRVVEEGQYNGKFFYDIAEAQKSLRKLRLEFENCRPRFTAGPLDSDSYFSHEQSVRIQSQLITAVLAIIVRVKNAIPVLGEAENLEQSLAWGAIQLVQRFSEAAAKTVMTYCKELVAEIEISVPKRQCITQQQQALDEYWEQQEQQLQVGSQFQKRVDQRKNVQSIRTTILEVKAVQDVFMESLQAYGQQILRIYDLNVSSEGNLTQANKFITRAKKNLSDSTKLTVVLMSLAIAGLWWIDRARGG